MFGAGAGADLGFPSWSTLIERIASEEEVHGAGLIGASEQDPLPMAAQVLFHHYHDNTFQTVLDEVEDRELAERMVARNWREIVHRALYQDVSDDVETFAALDTSYGEFLDVILRSPLTVTYNFDDAIERLLERKRKLRAVADGESRGRGYESLVDPRLVFRRAEGNILHINGYLPSNPLEAVEGPLVLNEISFADQLIDSIAGAYSTLLHFLTKHTFLLVGLSLSDETLRHLLRQNSLLNPGHFHYRIHWLPTLDRVEQGEALAETHFETFNLETLYLTSEEIKALGKLISASASDLALISGHHGIELFYTYYLAGVPGAGKTTNFRHFSSLVAYDEWYEERLEIMSKPFQELTDAERDEVDLWVRNQIMLKNFALNKDAHGPGIGINIVDRCPPDAIAFTDPEGWSEKAQSIREAVANGKQGVSIVPGTVILLVGEPEELLYRAKARDRQSTATAEYVDWHQRALQLIYAGAPGDRVPGTIEVQTRGRSVRNVVQQIARIIYHDAYEAVDLQRRVEGFEAGRIDPPGTSPPRSGG